MKTVKWNTSEKRRKKAVWCFAAFLLIMLLCTIISRGIYAWQMPRVQIGKAEQRNISHTVTAEGRIEADIGKAVVVEEGIRVAEVCVRIGEKIQQGTVLLRLDTEDLKKLSEEVTARIEMEQQKLAVLKAGRSVEQQTVQAAKQRALEDLENTIAVQDEAVNRAWQEYSDAEYELSAYPSWESYQEMNENADTSAWEQGMKQLEDALAQKETALYNAEVERDKAVVQARRAVEDAENKAPADESGITEAGQTISQLETKLAAYQKLQENDGQVVSMMAGNVGKICVEAGDRTTDSAAMILADGSEGWNFKAVLSEEQADYVKTGSNVTLKFQNDRLQKENCEITAVTQKEEGGYEAVVKVMDEALSLGESGKMELTKQSGPYPCCIPLSALYADNDRNYILMIRETETILGTELSVVRQDVTVKDKNEGSAALEDGSLGANDQFVVFSSKEVSPGDKVRLMEEGDE
ncbi:hypothetical protein MCG98_14615 [Ruminococcus sp. OA3]|nr:hypothetical protein [Ruminococcus sp. OA3]MCH1983802.1 hypothetical protein [Ruminococcus sp. OA3]